MSESGVCIKVDFVGNFFDDWTIIFKLENFFNKFDIWEGENGVLFSSILASLRTAKVITLFFIANLTKEQRFSKFLEVIICVSDS